MFVYSLKTEQISLGKAIFHLMLLLAIICTLVGLYFQFLFMYKVEKFCYTKSWY